ncbi:spermidine/putrescine ABC transporter substrate-binding protein [Mycolicibacterium sp. 018/SC-01/001]|uniref:polyamine ABC transporter substrate-binding protein n=1 Tax=Mycolicibacterium sp. 018/SC-01/001 TaxID=2592069 RepID=UPI00117D611A|nr:spermidine/putrescine ABC transporter substrate-binding protein [Mycolicibacterium sp. 018/SC-01/001]TRW80976.1 spermidine/putrescine ABC transporter substrate-binding protein [Mycolicibacterium sp. 018/SC-01/001]
MTSTGRSRLITSRRHFLGQSATAAAAMLAGSGLLAACGSATESPNTPARATAPPDDGRPASGTLRVSNWPLYIAEGFVADFQRATGLVVDYHEDYNDDEQWFAKVKEPLSRRQDIGCDLVIPSETIDSRLIALGWVNEIRESRWPNKANLQPSLLNTGIDPGRKMTAPYMNGIVGLAYNRAATGRDLTSVDDLWDRKFAGKVSVLSDLRDGLGMIMLAQRNTPEDPSEQSVQQAIDTVTEQKNRGQIRRFTGNDYGDDLATGNTVVAQAYSGDVIQLAADNPDLRFVVPDSGSTLTLQSMVIPVTTGNQAAAEAWINYVYDRANYAKLVAYTHYLPVLSDMADELAKIDPQLATNPLINPPPQVMARLKQWKSLSDQQSKQFSDLYAAVTST